MSMLGVSRFARRKQAAPAPRVRAPENVQWLLQEAQAPPVKRPMYHSKVWPLGVVAPLPAVVRFAAQHRSLGSGCAAKASPAKLLAAQPGRSGVTEIGVGGHTAQLEPALPLCCFV